jgi:hypothetical protein
MTGLLNLRGCSKEAASVYRAIQEHRQRIQESNALGFPALPDELWTVWNECREANWDGYDALPVSEATFQNAHWLLESLPLGCPPPSVGAEPGGTLTFEWHRGRRRTLTMSVNDEGELHYAALLGPARQHGSEVFNREIPPRIITLINEVCAYD